MAKNAKQQAAIAINMKAAGKKPKKMQEGGPKQPAIGQYNPYSKEIKSSKAGSLKPTSTESKTDTSKVSRTGLKIKLPSKSKYQAGGSLKPVDSSKNPGLAKLPTAVRNKMGYQKKGGSVKKSK
jgi:hypothetical protein